MTVHQGMRRVRNRKELFCITCREEGVNRAFRSDRLQAHVAKKHPQVAAARKEEYLAALRLLCGHVWQPNWYQAGEDSSPEENPWNIKCDIKSENFIQAGGC